MALLPIVLARPNKKAPVTLAVSDMPGASGACGASASAREAWAGSVMGEMMAARSSADADWGVELLGMLSGDE